jgi:hypothetical protein
MTSNEIIGQLDKFQVRLFRREDDGTVVPADPVTLAENLLLIRGLLIQLVDKVADAELDYRKSKAARFDKFLKEEMKRSPAMDQLDFEQDLIDKKIATERLRNYMKYVDGLCTSIQSVLRVQSGSEKSQY